MPDIEKNTMSVGRVAGIVIFVSGITAQYFTQKAATKDAIREIKEEFQEKYKDLSFENQLQNTAIEGIKDSEKFTYNTLTAHIEKCENQNFKMYRK